MDQVIKALKQDPASPATVLPHLTKIITQLKACLVEDWLEAELLETLVGPLLNLTPKLSTPRWPNASVALHLQTVSIQCYSIASNRGAWAILVNWGILCPAAEQPLGIDVSPLVLGPACEYTPRVPGSTPADHALHDPWTVRLLTLHCTKMLAVICERCGTEGMMGGVDNLHDVALVPAATTEV